MIRVLIADDQGIVRSGLRLIVDSQSDMEVVAEAADGIEAVALAREHAPDVVLMDIRMPRVDGIEATRRLAARPEVSARVLVLTTFGEDEFVRQAMQAGAAGFLLKDAERRHLLGAIRAVAAGDEILDPAITRRLIAHLAARPPVVDGVPAQLAALTERELEVMRAVAGGRTNAEIAAELYVSPATVKTHVARVLEKLGARDRVQIVIRAYETGLLRAEGDPPAP